MKSAVVWDARIAARRHNRRLLNLFVVVVSRSISVTSFAILAPGDGSNAASPNQLNPSISLSSISECSTKTISLKSHETSF